jgi:hypothetical protein
MADRRCRPREKCAAAQQGAVGVNFLYMGLFLRFENMGRIC